jgi:hypothetical protein
MLVDFAITAERDEHMDATAAGTWTEPPPQPEPPKKTVHQFTGKRRA